MSFPEVRMRRLRQSPEMRELFAETRLHPSMFVKPLFVVPGSGVRREIPSLPGQFHLSPDEAAREARSLREKGVLSVLLFGLPEVKDAEGTSALDPQGPVPMAVRRIREASPGTVVMTDVCLCEYTDHGHCGILRGDEVANDVTLEALCAMALVHAEAGAQVIAPSDMMDGRVGAIRHALDGADFSDRLVLAYAAKHASVFYGPFRDAAGSAPAFGDRRTYQMPPGNAREAMREVRLDIEEGADAVMVKPAMPYLDIVRRVREMTDLPVAAYQVSGEYAMIEAAAAAGGLSREGAILESLTAIHRAGADIIITYYADIAADLIS